MKSTRSRISPRATTAITMEMTNKAPLLMALSVLRLQALLYEF